MIIRFWKFKKYCFVLGDGELLKDIKILNRGENRVRFVFLKYYLDSKIVLGLESGVLYLMLVDFVLFFL